MSQELLNEIYLEPERYELHAAPRYQFNIDRREFFRVVGRGLVVVLLVDAALDTLGQESGNAGRPAGGRGGGRGGASPEISAWLHIGEDGAIRAFTGKTEVGQNIRTSLAQAVAEELRVPLTSVTMVMADTDLVPWDAGTFGSQSTPQMARQLHRAAAAAREALLDLAAQNLGMDRSTLTVADGKISTADGKSATYGQLTKGQDTLKTVSGNPPVTPATEWKVAGHSYPKVNGREFVTGAHQYASDIKRPGMLRGKVLRPASFGATFVSADTSAAAAMPGVTVVKDSGLIGVVAPDEQITTQALEAIKSDWTPVPQPSSKEIYDFLKKNVTTGGRGGGGGFGGGGGNSGSMDDGLAAADQKLQQTYTVAHIAHTPLEPRAAVAEWNGDKVTIWTGSQRPFGIRTDVAQAFGIAETNVRVIIPDTGSGYGGKHTSECAVEAARLAKGAGKPVKLVWTRAEEFTWAYLRPAGVIEVRSGVKNDGTLTAWEFHNYNSGNASLATPYSVPNKQQAFHPTRYTWNQGSYKSLAACANTFARETHMDELAALVKMDPLEFRLKNLPDSAAGQRLRDVLQAAAKAFGWGSKPPAGHGCGIALGTDKDSYLATCAEIAVDEKTREVKVLRVVQSFDCGAVVNPDQLKNQVEGAVVMGIGGALFEAMEYENGKMLNARLSAYRVPRFSDAPKIEVVLMDRNDQPSAGAGETPIIGISPAINGAIFNATGQRLRAMPMAPNGLPKA